MDLLILMTRQKRTTRLHKKDDHGSWFVRLKQFLQVEPQNKEQLINLLRDAQIRSLIDAETLGMIEGVILFAQMRVRDIMLPKNQMICIPEDAELAEIINIVTNSGHSRFPVTGNDKDDVIGILHAKDLLRYNLQQKTQFEIQDIIRQATFVPESKRLDLLLNQFRINRNHMAIVVDEYGAVAGFVTLEDIIEQIIGDIEDEFDIDEETYIKAHGDDRYIIKGHTPIDEFNEQLHVAFSEENYDTIGGVVLNKLGHLPTRGEVITINELEFKIINADARRIKLMECIDLRHASRPMDQSKALE